MSEPDDIDATARRWGQNIAVAVAAVLTLVVGDLVLQRVTAPLPTRIEVADGVAEYEAGDPAVFILGSSHSRGFSVIKERLAERFGRPDHLVQMAVEYGKLSSYRWVVDHRLKPLIEERDEAGELVRPSLEHVVLITEWWDACQSPGGLSDNIPARAWTAADFAADAAVNGWTDFNRNWLRYQWSSRLTGSILVSDRGVRRLPRDLIGLIRPRTAEQVQRERDLRVKFFSDMIEGGMTNPACFHPDELADAEAMIRYFQARDVEVTILLYPRMPVTLSDKGNTTTVARFEDTMNALGKRTGVRIIDWVATTPLTDADFMDDLDHTTAEGNRKIADHGLGGDFSFLLESRR